MRDGSEVLIIRHDRLTTGQVGADRVGDVARISQCDKSSGKTPPLCAGRERQDAQWSANYSV